MASIPEVIERWLDILEGRTERGNLNGANVYGSGASLYSYGSHFTLAELHRPGPWRDPASGRVHIRRRPLFLLNGNRVSVSTSRHQSETRSAVSRRAYRFGADVVIIPFSALDAAGILRPTVTPLEIREDSWIELARRPVPVDLSDVATATETVLTSRVRYGPGLGHSDVPVRTHRWDVDGYRFERDEYLGEDSNGPGAAYVQEWPQGEPHELTADYRFVIRRAHRLGGSLFTAAVAGTREIRRECSVADVIRAAVRSIDARRRGFSGILDIAETLDNVDTDAPIVETVRTWRRRRFVSSFDMNEPARPYFLATLPGSSRARTVETALEDLAPAAVHAAIARGRDVVRQGDIFGIATSLSDVDVATFERARLTLWTRNARARDHEPGYAAPLSAADRRRVLQLARRYWRERFRSLHVRGPQTSPGARKRFARLVAERAAKVERARDDGRRAILQARLDTVREWVTWQASETGTGYYRERAVVRGAESSRHRIASVRSFGDSHGYMSRAHSRDGYRMSPRFLSAPLALSLWQECNRLALETLRPQLRAENRDRARARARALLSVHGTAHTATEVARGPGGAVYMRGTMRHEPRLIGENRGRDHVAVRLGDGGTWYLAVRNTVPRASRDGNGRS